MSAATDPQLHREPARSDRGATTPVEPVEPAPGAATSTRLGVLLVAGGAVGLWAAFTLVVERVKLLLEPSTTLSCDLNPVVSCGSVMTSWQASVFGFPNPLLGVVGFTVVLVTGVVVLSGVRLPAWYWAGLQVGALLGVVFVHWLIWNSLYRIGALCPYCMAVWVVTIPLFVAITARNLGALRPRLGPRAQGLTDTLLLRQPVLVVAWYLVIASLILQRFWVFWRTQLP